MIESIAFYALLSAPSQAAIQDMRQRAAIVIHCRRPDPLLAEMIRAESQRRAIVSGDYQAVADHAVSIADALARAVRGERPDCGGV